MNEKYYNDYYGVIPDYNYNNQNLIYRGLPPEFRETSKSKFYNAQEGFTRGNMQINTYEPYKYTNPTLPQLTSEREKLMSEIQKYSFAMWDLNLYLNVYPDDKEAMKLYSEYRKTYRDASDYYKKKYGPLYVGETDLEDTWKWNESPWPWEVR